MHDSLETTHPNIGENLVAQLHCRIIAADVAGQPLPQIGKFILKDRLGAGAMGIVFRAHDPQLGRDVALKFISELYSGDPAFQRRLIAEAKTLARLDAPQIVPIYEFGEYAGQTFMAMKLHEGETLATWTLRATDWRAIVDAYIQAGEGLAAAHRGGCVHRDFKPDNAIIDANGMVKVIDFGLSRDLVSLATDPEFGTGSLSTGGASPYVAPELRQGRRADARSDQYAFCIALHEALGRLGRHGPKRRARVPAGIHRALRRGLDDDPVHRWPTMEALLAVLRTVRRGRRNLWLGVSLMTTITTAMAFALVVQGSRAPLDPLIVDRPIVGAILAAPGPEQARIAPRLFRETTQVSDQTALAAASTADRIPRAIFRHGAEIDGGVLSPDGTTVATSAGGSVHLWPADGRGDPVQLHDHGVSALVFSHDGKRLAGVTDGNTVLVWTIGALADPIVLAGHDRKIRSLAFTADDQSILTTSWDREAQLWNVEDGNLRTTLAGSRGIHTSAILFHDQAKALTSIGGDVHMWPLTGPRPEPERTFTGAGADGSDLLELDSGGAFFAARSPVNGGFRIWPLRGDASPVTPRDAGPNTATYLAISPQGSMLAAAYTDGCIRVWTVGKWDMAPTLITGGPAGIRTLRFSPDGRHLAASTREGTIRVWDPREASETFTIHHGNAGESASIIQFSADSKTLLTVGGKTAQTWSIDGWITVRQLGKHAAGRVSAIFSHKGDRLLTWAQLDPTIRIMPTAGLTDPVLLTNPIEPSAYEWRIGVEHGIRSVQFSPDDSKLLVATDNDVWLMDSDGTEIPIPVRPHHRFNRDAVYSPDGRSFAVLGEESWRLHEWAFGQGEMEVNLPRNPNGTMESLRESGGTIRFDAAGRHVLVLSQGAHLYPSGSRDSTTLGRPEGNVTAGRFSPDGTTVLLAVDDGATLYSLDGRTLVTLRGHTGAIHDVAFSGNGDRIATASHDGTVRIWSTDGREEQILTGHEGPVLSVHFLQTGDRVVSNGSRVVTGSEDRTARVWDLSDATRPLVFRGHERGVHTATFSPDGRLMVTAAHDGTIRLWRWNPEDIREALKQLSSDCLIPTEREAYLQDDEATARSKWQECEEGHQRTGLSPADGRPTDPAERRVELQGDCSTLDDAAPMCFIACASGSFQMGSEDAERAIFATIVDGYRGTFADETPHVVNLGAFELAATEVTNAQFKVVMGEPPIACGFLERCNPNDPAGIVFYDTAVEYANKLTDHENERLGLQRTRCYTKQAEAWVWDRACTGFRLPTEAEWEYAARAGTRSAYGFGDDYGMIAEYAWLNYNSEDRAHPVGRKKPNAWGFHDMHGNVLEWTWDFYAPYDTGQPDNPSGPARGDTHIVRGGCYLDSPKHLRSAMRRSEGGGISENFGFRVARGAIVPPTSSAPAVP